MNYSKKSTSRKQKALKSKKRKMGKKLSVVFLKTLLVLCIALGVAGVCGGIGIVKGVIENVYCREDINLRYMMRMATRRRSWLRKEPTVLM